VTAAPATFRARARLGSSIRDHLFVAAVLLAALLAAGQAQAQFVKTNVASFSTSSTTFTPVTGGSLTFTPGTTSEIWIILVSARLMSTQTASFTLSAEARYRVNAVEHGIGGILNSAANKGASWQHFYRVTGTTAAQTVQVDLRDDSGATATIADLQIIAFPLPSGADFRYTENEAIRAIPSPWTTYETLGFTPSSPGTYLVMALANATEDPGTGGIGIRFEHPAATYWPDMSGGNRLQYMSNTRIPWQSFFLARAVSLTATPQSFNLQATGDLAPGSQIAYTRIMAFRTDVFDLFESQADTGITSTTSTTPVVRSTLTTAAPPTARDYVVIQSQVISGTAAVDENRAGFEADDVVQTSYDHVFNGSFHYGSFGFFDAVTRSASTKYENTWSTSNAASAVEIKESVIHVLRLPVQVSFRSIGIDAGNLHAAGTASVAQGSNTVTFSAALPDPGAVGAVGPGDELTIEGETLFVRSRDSAFQVTVETAATVDHSTPTAAFTITRAYNTVSAWEADISVGGRGGDLVGEGRREIGFAYKDGPFTAGFSISGSTTDSSRYMHLTVPPGQRHTGIAGTGVVLDGGGTIQTMLIRDDYTRLEWFESRNHKGADGNVVSVGAQNVLVSDLIVHDFDDGVGSTNIDGISLQSAAGTFSLTVRNSIVYDGEDSCIQGDQADDTVTIENCTLYGCRRGVHEDTTSTMNIRNTIAMGNSSVDFNVTVGTLSNNLSEDGSPPIAPSSTGLPANQRGLPSQAGCRRHRRRHRPVGQLRQGHRQ
jgi:hypothetical protein